MGVVPPVPQLLPGPLLCSVRGGWRGGWGVEIGKQPRPLAAAGKNPVLASNHSTLPTTMDFQGGGGGGQEYDQEYAGEQHGPPPGEVVPCATCGRNFNPTSLVRAHAAPHHDRCTPRTRLPAMPVLCCPPVLAQLANGDCICPGPNPGRWAARHAQSQPCLNPSADRTHTRCFPLLFQMKHGPICAKSKVNAKKRGAFDASKQRVREADVKPNLTTQREIAAAKKKGLEKAAEVCAAPIPFH